jgi:hypothetical protein
MLTKFDFRLQAILDKTEGSYIIFLVRSKLQLQPYPYENQHAFQNDSTVLVQQLACLAKLGFHPIGGAMACR